MAKLVNSSRQPRAEFHISIVSWAGTHAETPPIWVDFQGNIAGGVVPPPPHPPVPMSSFGYTLPFARMLEQAEETTGAKAPLTLADAGYYSGNNLEKCAGRGQAVAMPESLPSPERPYHRDRFVYDERSDSFTCPKGQILHFERIQQSAKNDGVRNRVYRAPWKVCRSCPAFGVCTKSKRGRSIAIGKHDAILRGHRAWMSSDTAKEAYKLRKQLVEPVFGIIKEQQRARRFLLRGLANVAAEWTFLATAFNLRTLWKAWRSRGFTFPNGGLQPQPAF